jgi:hypothetical protein
MNLIRRRRLGTGKNYPLLGAAFVGGSNQNLSIADNAALSMGAGVKLTICAWMMPTSVATTSQVIAKFNGAAAGTEYSIQLNTSAQASFRVSDGTTIRNSNVVTLTVNAWNFVMGQYDGTNLYASLNGGAFTVAVTGADIQNGALTFRIGTDSNALNGYTGSLDCVGLWKRALSAAEVGQIYNGGIGMAYQDLTPALATSLTAWYDLDDSGGSASTWLDRLGTSNLTAGAGAAAPTSTAGKR